MKLIVTPAPQGVHHSGTLKAFGEHHACALGRGGITAGKREGDGFTPLGSFPLRAILYRADRLELPATRLPATPIAKTDGWCDDPTDPVHYNRPVTLPHASSAEAMWRDDALYDLVVVLGHNDAPPIPGLGSAIFLHCAADDETGELRPTEGCVALPRATLKAIVPRLTPKTLIEIRASA